VLHKRRDTGRIVLGIDPSSEKLAAVWSREGSRIGHLVTTKLSGTPAQRCTQAVQWCQLQVAELATLGQVYVWVEDPYVGRYVGAAIPLARAQGCVLAGCAIGGAVLVENVRPADWKRITGSGAAKKDAIAAWIEREWPSVHELIQHQPKGIRQDFADAGAINRHGNRVLSIASELGI
jgi:Holliday junction resolvasome RuvABC endonuclease subunit